MLHFPERDGETGELKKVQYIINILVSSFDVNICLKGKLALMKA